MLHEDWHWWCGGDVQWKLVPLFGTIDQEHPFVDSANSEGWYWLSDWWLIYSPIYSDTTQVNWTSSWVELCRYKWGLRLCSHRHESESKFPFTVHTSFTCTSGAFTVTRTSTTHRVSIDNLQWNRIEWMLWEKKTVFHYIANNFAKHSPLTMKNLTVT